MLGVAALGRVVQRQARHVGLTGDAFQHFHNGVHHRVVALVHLVNVHERVKDDEANARIGRKLHELLNRGLLYDGPSALRSHEHEAQLVGR